MDGSSVGDVSRAYALLVRIYRQLHAYSAIVSLTVLLNSLLLSEVLDDLIDCSDVVSLATLQKYVLVTALSTFVTGFLLAVTVFVGVSYLRDFLIKVKDLGSVG